MFTDINGYEPKYVDARDGSIRDVLKFSESLLKELNMNLGSSPVERAKFLQALQGIMRELDQDWLILNERRLIKGSTCVSEASGVAKATTFITPRHTRFERTAKRGDQNEGVHSDMITAATPFSMDPRHLSMGEISSSGSAPTEPAPDAGRVRFAEVATPAPAREQSGQSARTEKLVRELPSSSLRGQNNGGNGSL